MNHEPGRLIRAGRRIAVATAAMTLALTVIALAGVQRRATTSVPPMGFGTAIAKCKHGQVALAGGFAAPGWDPHTANGGPVARIDLVPTGARKISTTGFNFNQNDAQELDSFAYCATRARPPKVVSKDVVVALDSFDSVTAHCPNGSQAIAGGFGTDQSVITLTSKRSGKRGWKVTGVNSSGLNGSTGPQTLTAYAICKNPGAKLVTRSKDVTVSSDLATTQVKCPNGDKALSGGFDGHVGIAGGQLRAAGVLDSTRAERGRGWTSSAISTMAPQEATATTYAYCRT
jgi:hypothetical protein